ncbi:MAG: ACT domain-containing protein [Elusimicrobia bacterium]|nr:ACT domain-containing protein [Elusimicrobiota bacterium]
MKQIVTEFSVPAYDKPGTLAKLTQVLSQKGINITATTTLSLGDVAYMRFVVNNENGVKKILENAGFQVLETPAYSVELPNRPGELNKLAKALASKSINIHQVYGSVDGGQNAKLIVSVDQIQKAAPIFAKWAHTAFATR